MSMHTAITTVMEHHDLSSEMMTDTMRLIMTGHATDAQIGGFLIGLRMKGETVDEIVAAARVMRELASKVLVSGKHLVDTCGTGGDASGSFNISTACAFVAAAAGAQVAKHGNRSVSSKSGSADVLEAAGVNLDLSPEQVAHCIEEIGVGFLFAPKHHSAMKHAIGPRKEMAVRTLFNVLGPLTNPASAPNQVLGVFDADWVEPLAEVLKQLGSRHVMVVHAVDGLDEISIASETLVAELKDGEIKTYQLSPEQFALPRTDLSHIRVDGAQESLTMIRSVLANEATPARDIVALNAGAAIYVSGITTTLEAGVEKALEVIASGAAAERLAKLVSLSQA
ncbi:MAG: anthranilate phosphoribosyltransferase [Gammaproteobacteria bacterium]|nr:anthranilate phosphoribosyltransferase [Gammaproteobacteria bacterium]